MIIIAWNGSGDLSMVFTSSVFKKVLSVFITAAVLKLGQGLYNYFFLCSIEKLYYYLLWLMQFSWMEVLKFSVSDWIIHEIGVS